MLKLLNLDANNLYGWAMSQKLPENGSEWAKKFPQFDESFIRNYDENSDIGYFLEVDIDYLEKLFRFHECLPFLPERKKVNKVEKLIWYRRQRKICYAYKSLKTRLKSWIRIKKST